ncbi:hypothetical protein K438DRAFT_1801648 [Mycena galopus ATCC 62051]|nr:hypothetical protein K438DRAFT_1801648 [Mycena galopus ATCC 62051]
MFASLAKPDDDTELHWLKDGRTRCTAGSVVSSLYALKDPTAPGAASNADASGSPAAAEDGPMTSRPPPPTRASSSSPTSRSARRARTASSWVCSRSLGTTYPAARASKAHRSTSPPRKGSPAWRISVFFWLLRPPTTPSSHHTSIIHLSTESSPLICSLADQSIKIRIRNDIWMRKARHARVGRPLLVP